jgi:hypothetical protein
MRAAVRDSLRTLATDLLTSPEVPQDQIDDVLALVEAGIPDQIERDVAEFAAHWDRGVRVLRRVQRRRSFHRRPSCAQSGTITRARSTASIF